MFKKKTKRCLYDPKQNLEEQKTFMKVSIEK